MNPFLIMFTLFLTVSFLVSEIFYKLKYPRVIGLIFAGILLGLFPGLLFAEGSYLQALENENVIALALKGIGEIGAIFLLLLVGLEIDLEKMKTVSRDVFAIGIFASLIPFFLGFFVMKAFFGATTIAAFIVGACLAISAEGTKSMILMEEGRLKTRVGEIMLGAGALDDVLGILFLSTVIVIAQGGEPSQLAYILVHQVPFFEGLNHDTGGLFQLLLLPLEFLVFIVVVRLLFNIIPQTVEYTKRERSEVAEFMTVIILGLSIAIFAELFGLGTIIGALIAGVVMQVAIVDREEEQKIIETLKTVSLSLVVPFFFLSIGLYFDPGSLFNAPELLLAIVAVAVFGKLAGSYIAKPFTDLTARQLYLIGWGMNSRGAVELVIASVALPLLIEEMGIAAATDIFSAIIAMAIITTIMFPFFLKREISRYPGLMD